MLSIWIFVLMIDGKVEMTYPADSETACKAVMNKAMALNRALGNKSTGACYVRATAIDDTDRMEIGHAIENR
jgi:hypothetical protein